MGTNRRNLEGLYFGRLKVLFYYDTYKPFTTSRSRWLCECICGNFIVIEARRLLAGNAYSCGCGLFKTQKHGMTKTRIYKYWKNIKGKKVGVCQEWLDFEKLYKWSLEHNYNDSLFLKLIEQNKEYSPLNCEWASKHKRICVNCGGTLSHRNKKYCSGRCQHEFQHSEAILKWKNGELEETQGTYKISDTIRRFLFNKYNNACALCGWNKTNPYTKKIPLEVEHIDGNHTNNREDNLLLLCPNCHSLTSTYKGANRGNGRKERVKHYLPSQKALSNKQAAVV